MREDSSKEVGESGGRGRRGERGAGENRGRGREGS